MSLNAIAIPAVRVAVLHHQAQRRAAWLAIATFALGPVAGLWRQVFLRPMMFYAYLTFWKVGNWGTREEIEVGAVAVEPAAR